MRNSSLLWIWEANPTNTIRFIKILFRGFVLGAVASGTFYSVVFASGDLDHYYSLESIGYLRSWDNVDGLFEQYVQEAYNDYFATESRFRAQSLSAADKILKKSQAPYKQLIQDKEILLQVARSMRVESLIRTQVQQESDHYRFTLDWIHAPKVEILASYEFDLPVPPKGGALAQGELRKKLQQALGTLFSKVPIVAQITGRDEQWVTLNLGYGSKLRPGDVALVGTLEEVKRHPVLHSIEDWVFKETGRIQISEVDEKLAFGRILEATSNVPIDRYQKVTRVVAQNKFDRGDRMSDARDPVDSAEAEPTPEDWVHRPQLGWIALGGWVGNFSRDYITSSTGAQTGKSGSGFLLGGRGEGQIWLTENIFVGLGFAYGFFNYSQKDLTTGASGTGSSASVSQFGAEAGYYFLLGQGFFGPKGWAKLGYHSTSISLPTSTSEFTGPSSIGSLYVGLGVDLTLNPYYGILLGIDFGMMKSYSETGFTTGSTTGVTDVSFFFGGYHWLSPRMSIRAGVTFWAQGADFSNGTDLSHQVLSFTPSLLYYF